MRERAGRLHLVDAAIGMKTGKNGKDQWYFGYALHVIVRSPKTATAGTKRPEPALAERFRVTPASTDVVDVTFENIDAVRTAGRTIRRIMGDRHYSYKAFDRWLTPLLERGIEQVADLRSDEHGFKEWDSVLWAAGTPHCPHTPRHLGTIPRPGNGASRDDHATFERRIQEREAFSCQIRKPLGPDATIRFTCPAKAGKIGCPLQPATMVTAREYGLPIVAMTPTGNHPPVCTQDSVGFKATTDPQKSILRLNQKITWGSPKWIATYARRTFVEGFFGNLKGENASNKKRGNNLYYGMAHTTLDLLAFVVASNVRILRSWHEETGLGDPTSPLLTADTSPDMITITIRPDEYQLLEEARALIA